MYNIEFIFILVLILLGLSFLIQSFDTKLELANSVIDAALVPKFLSIILLVLLSIYLISLFQKKIKNSKENDSPSNKVVFNQIIYISGLFISIFLVDILGLLVTIGLFILFTLIIIEKKTWGNAVLFTLASMACFYIIFVVLLGLPLPGGILS